MTLQYAHIKVRCGEEGLGGGRPNRRESFRCYFTARDLESRLAEGIAGLVCLQQLAGSSIDDFLVKGVVAWHLADAMKKQKISKNQIAMLLKTSRTQVDRLLDLRSDITVSSL